MRPARTGRVRDALLVTAGAVLAIASMEVVGRLELFGTSWPPLSDVLDVLRVPATRALLARALGATATEAGIGLLAGTLAAAAVAALGVLLPVLQPGLDRLAAVVNAIPLIALGPLLIALVGREDSPAVVAALAVGFVMFVSLTSGLEAASRAHSDVFAALGASRATTLLRLRLPASVPTALDGLTQAAPAAVLGAVIGEWFGAPRGLGTLLVSTMQNYQTLLLWAAGTTAALLAMASYAVVGTARSLIAWRFQ
ncbi:MULTISPECIES: ABC transporter permease [unclassified Streptomyces]|uniref:ABC transporter permease n=1 Tax=unclassified Streptomyces TaxID=2593676 RepID=UPI00073B7467|nr:ABC transporter permease subunit [Streptomyces sp. AVP053U2]ODA72670.1 Binding-protein-dependent transport system inner membrane component [Streptomyces sp. AVP053U2]